MRRCRFKSRSIDGAGRYARKKSLVKQFRCPKTCPTRGSECPDTHGFMSTGRHAAFSVKLPYGAEKLTASTEKFDTGVSKRRTSERTQSTARRERPVLSAVSSRGEKSETPARHSRSEISRPHFSPSDGAEAQVMNWNCIVSVRQSIHAVPRPIALSA